MSKLKLVKFNKINLKSTTKNNFNYFYYGDNNYWKYALYNHYKIHIISNLIKKILNYENLILNNIHFQYNNNNIKLIINTVSFFERHKSIIKFKKALISKKRGQFKKRLIKISYIVLNYINVKTLKINFYNSCIPINYLIKFAKLVHKKEKFESYYHFTFQAVNCTFIGNTSSSILSNLVYIFTKRNPRRVKFLFFLKRVIIWYFNNLSNKSKIDGVRIEVKGRFNPKSRARKQILSVGKIRKSECSSIVDYKHTVAITKFGSLSIKVWVCPTKYN
jgi:hypothetical protein